jgi:MinD superfamily P-loop ATPase
VTDRLCVAVASGKGGTGKTTLAVNLALAAGAPVDLLDCDVEEPNADLFLGVRFDGSAPVTIPVPEVDKQRCTACGACGELCRYSAIVSLGSTPILFPQLCHGCGGCRRVCPADAIREVSRPIGEVQWGRRGAVRFAHGRLTIGEATAPPVIRAVKRALPQGEQPALTLIDAPPGTSCPVIEALRGADFVLLVTEPTPFGLHDLTLAVEMVRKLGLPSGVVINRDGIGDWRVATYCRAEGIPILLRIPEDRRIAQTYSRGEPVVEALPEYRERFAALHDDLRKHAEHAGA